MVLAGRCTELGILDSQPWIRQVHCFNVSDTHNDGIIVEKILRQPEQLQICSDTLNPLTDFVKTAVHAEKHLEYT